VFAPRISKSPIETSEPSRATRVRGESSLFAPPISHSSIRDSSEAAACAPSIRWSFDAIPVFPAMPAIASSTRAATAGMGSSFRRQTYPFSARLHAVVKGSQSDAASADHQESKAGQEASTIPSAVPESSGLKPKRTDGETIPIPKGALPSISGEQADTITTTLNYTGNIQQLGPPPSEFGLTVYKFLPENFSVGHRAATPGTAAGSGSAGTPATPASFLVGGDIRGVITYQVNNSGRTDIASDSDSSITQTNYPDVVSDLTPPSAAVKHAGRLFMKNQPFRDHYWARDLTVKHELFHCREDQSFGKQGVEAAQNWLNTQTANSKQQLMALLPGIMTRIGNAITQGRAAPADEQRAYDDGAPLYLARAQAIKRKGDAKGYLPKAAAPPQQAPGSPPATAPKTQAPQPPATTPSK
jgi:hypothetical protein